jgi:hypothetical protein
VNSLSRIPPSLAESSPRRKPALVLWLYEFLLTADNSKWVSDVRAGEYLSYYEKYYDDRENSLKAIADSGSKLPA